MDADPRPAVLIVDDDDDVRAMYELVLADAGYRVQAVADGRMALERLRASTAGLVVMLDLMMPGMDGRQVLEAVALDERLATRHTYLLLTAVDSPHMLPQEFRELLAKIHVPVMGKPFPLTRLLRAVEQAAARLARS